MIIHSQFIMNEQIEDIQEAKIIISLKDDEIKSLQNKMITLEKRTKIKLAEANYRLQQEKNKLIDIERKYIKIVEGMKKDKSKCDLLVAGQQKQIQNLIQKISKMAQNEKNKQRQMKFILNQKEHSIEIEKQKNDKLINQLSKLYLIFDPIIICERLGKNDLSQLVSYLKLYEKNMEKDEQIKQLNLQMERLKLNTLSQIEEAFSQLTSYEEVMEQLHKQNKQLELNAIEKQSKLHQTQNELENKKLILKEIQQISNQQYERIARQNHYLKCKIFEMEKVQKQYYELEQQCRLFAQTTQNLEEKLDQKEEQSRMKFEKYQVELQKSHDQNKQLELFISDFQKRFDEEIEHHQILVKRLQKSLLDKEQIVQMLNHTLQQQEVEFEKQKQESIRYAEDINQLIRKKRKSEQEAKLRQENHKIILNKLSEQISSLKFKLDYHNSQQQPNQKTYLLEIDQFKSNDSKQNVFKQTIQQQKSINYFEIQKNNLLTQLEENISNNQNQAGLTANQLNEPNYEQLYRQMLIKHNNFIKQTYIKLQKIKDKQIRKCRKK